MMILVDCIKERTLLNKFLILYPKIKGKESYLYITSENAADNVESPTTPTTYLVV